MEGIALAVVLSFVPSLMCVFLLYWIDRYEKEPKVLLGAVFVWGAFFATVSAVIAQVALQGITVAVSGSPAAADVAGATIFAPVSEELLKGVAVLFVFLALRHEFDSILDGIVYAGTVALGFAATENVLYLHSAYLEDGGDGLAGLFIVRVVLGIWNHPMYTSFFGMGLALSRLSRDRSTRFWAPLGGLTLAIVMHSAHNAQLVAPKVSLLEVLLLDWAGWAFVAVVAISAARSEGRLIGAELAEEAAAGLLSGPQLRTASSSLRRQGALARGLVTGRFTQTRHLYQACAELAHKKKQLREIGDEDGNLKRVGELRDRIRRTSPSAPSWEGPRQV